MKKVFALFLAALLCTVICIPVNAAEVLYKYECEDGVISGAAMDYKDGDIQDVAIASGGKIVGLGGTNDYPTAASTVMFSGVDFPYDGTYDITLCYDASNSDTRKADLLVDGTRYAVDIDTSSLPDEFDQEFQLYTLELALTAGKHDIGVTDSEDFNRDANAGPVVKSVNADYIEIALVEKTEETTAAAAETASAAADTAAVGTTAAAPQTFDFIVIPAALAIIGAVAIIKKR